jgi:hypothetical protein
MARLTTAVHQQRRSASPAVMYIGRKCIAGTAGEGYPLALLCVGYIIHAEWIGNRKIAVNRALTSTGGFAVDCG